ncbi:MAG: hypothetical protein IPP77_03800 [Bacteroidetes bacterium]|nr:hypothetical protein [Bacteroidota bacterium]
MKHSKPTKAILRFLLALCLLSFAPSKRSYQTECVSLATEGYVTLKIWDIQKGNSYQQEQARKDAIDALLFSGIAGNNGCTTQKPILSSATEIEQFQKIEKDFFSKNGVWANYTRESNTETTVPSSIGDKNWKVYRVSVAKNLLRKYLEEGKIIAAEEKVIIKSLKTGF